MSVVFLFGVLWNKTTTRAANFVLTAGTFLSMGTGFSEHARTGYHRNRGFGPAPGKLLG
jgi:hypothetical protein